MKTRFYSLTSAVLFLCGVLIYAWYHEYIIINPRKSFIIPHENSTHKRTISLYHFKEQWRADSLPLLLSQEDTQNARILVGRWLEIALDEGLIKKKVSVQTAFITSNQELILSFDRSIFAKESSTFDKWMIIEGILKSLKENVPHIKNVRFLVNHQPFVDTHLDLGNAWPISGFAY